MQSLLLDTATWDLTLDINGNVAVCTETYSILQDVSTAIRMFLGECWYNTELGLPYFQQILGAGQSVAVFKSDAEAAALTVPGVAQAVCVLTGLSATRQLSGQIQITTTAGAMLVVSFGPSASGAFGSLTFGVSSF